MDTPTTPISLAELAPSPEDIATLTTQYRKAVNGLYEAYLFGQMLLAVQKRLSLSLTRETKGEALLNGQ